jgi:hypothetical protein
MRLLEAADTVQNHSQRFFAARVPDLRVKNPTVKPEPGGELLAHNTISVLFAHGVCVIL